MLHFSCHVWAHGEPARLGCLLHQPLHASRLTLRGCRLCCPWEVALPKRNTSFTWSGADWQLTCWELPAPEIKPRRQLRYQGRPSSGILAYPENWELFFPHWLHKNTLALCLYLFITVPRLECISVALLITWNFPSFLIFHLDYSSPSPLFLKFIVLKGVGRKKSSIWVVIYLLLLPVGQDSANRAFGTTGVFSLVNKQTLNEG